jgi:hypothetical protein
MEAEKIINHYLKLGKTINVELDKFNYTYSIQDNSIFASNKNVIEMQKLYWQEMLQRAHWAALSALLRNLQWLKGVDSSNREKNFLAFASNLRALLESCGDSLHALQMVAPTLAEHNKVIKDILVGRGDPNKVYIIKDLENSLIHFSYARKVTKTEKIAHHIPEYQIAKQTVEYLKILDNKIENGPISQLYSWLCQFGHPSGYSTMYLFESGYSEPHHILRYIKDADEKQISGLYKEFNEEIVNALMLGLNPSLIILKTINHFAYKPVYTDFADKVDLSQLNSWIKIDEKLKSTNL